MNSVTNYVPELYPQWLLLFALGGDLSKVSLAIFVSVFTIEPIMLFLSPNRIANSLTYYVPEPLLFISTVPFRAVGIGGAEELQAHQYFRITVVKGISSLTNIQGLS